MSLSSFLMSLFGKGTRKGNSTSVRKSTPQKKRVHPSAPALKTGTPEPTKEMMKQSDDRIPEPVSDTVTGYVRIEKGKRVSTSA